MVEWHAARPPKGFMMAKFYVLCGDLKVITISETPRNAAIKAFESLKSQKVNLAKVTFVSERGFESDAEDACWMCTLGLLKETNNPKEWFPDD